MNNHSTNPQNNSDLFSARFGIGMLKTPFISPLQIVPSPLLHEHNIFDSNHPNLFFNNFQLEEELPLDELQEFPPTEEESNSPCIEEKNGNIFLDQRNMLEFILDNIVVNEGKVEKAMENFKDNASTFNKNIFMFLVSKFRKMRKTKEEMVKYCIRKSFKLITNRIRGTDKDHYMEMENYQIVAEYFQKNSEGDESISIPFKKNSEVKTMNTVFLKKIFSCRQYNIDYKEFLAEFPDEYTSDNEKKIKSMNEVIKKCLKTKSLKGLDEYVRLPWPTYLLDEINFFANKLFTEYSTFKNLKVEQEKEKQFDQIMKRIEKPKPVEKKKKYEDEFEIIRGHPRVERIPQPKVMSDPMDVLEAEMQRF